MNWTKSSYSSTNGSCVEVMVEPMTHVHDPEVYAKSSYSTGNGGSCVETSPCTCGEVLVRDSKDPDGPRLRFTLDEWKAFILGAKDGEFD